MKLLIHTTNEIRDRWKENERVNWIRFVFLGQGMQQPRSIRPDQYSQLFLEVIRHSVKLGGKFSHKQIKFALYE